MKWLSVSALKDIEFPYFPLFVDRRVTPFWRLICMIEWRTRYIIAAENLRSCPLCKQGWIWAGITYPLGSPIALKEDEFNLSLQRGRRDWYLPWNIKYTFKSDHTIDDEKLAPNIGLCKLVSNEGVKWRFRICIEETMLVYFNNNPMAFETQSDVNKNEGGYC